MPQMTAAQRNTCVRPCHWPEADRLAWERATALQRSPFRARGGGLPRSPASTRKMAAGYGCYVAFLEEHELLLPGETPIQRVNPERLDAYFLHLRGIGNADYTIVGRFAELRATLQWMYPGVDFGWIERPGGVSLRKLLPMRRRSVDVPDTAVLLAWAESLFQKGLAHHKPRCRRALVRDAVIIGLLTTCAPRLRALAALQLGTHLRRNGDEWLLIQDAAITKTRRPLELPVHQSVATMLERYLAVERQQLLGKTESDALWVAGDGGQLAYDTISRRVRLLTQARFATAFGPHRFRTCLATKLALNSPETPFDAALILGHSSPTVTLNHYNRAKSHKAVERWSKRLGPVAKCVEIWGWRNLRVSSTTRLGVGAPREITPWRRIAQRRRLAACLMARRGLIRSRRACGSGCAGSLRGCSRKS